MQSVRCRVSAEKIDPTWALKFSEKLGHGAQNIFLGSVRAVNVGKEVVAVEYDAFEPLAEQVFLEIAAEAQEKWGSDLKINVIHRVGKLAVGEISVAIGVSSTHRDEAFRASRYVIEQIKVRAPIWKKEYYADGETEWLKGHALCQHAPHSEDQAHVH